MQASIIRGGLVVRCNRSLLPAVCILKRNGPAVRIPLNMQAKTNLLQIQHVVKARITFTRNCAEFHAIKSATDPAKSCSRHASVLQY